MHREQTSPKQPSALFRDKGVFHMSQPLYKYNKEYIRIKQAKYEKQCKYKQHKLFKLHKLNANANAYGNNSSNTNAHSTHSQTRSPIGKENIQQYALFQIKKPKAGFYAMKGCNLNINAPTQLQQAHHRSNMERSRGNGEGGESGVPFFNYFIKKYVESNKHSLLQESEKILKKLPCIGQSQPYTYPSWIQEQQCEQEQERCKQRRVKSHNKSVSVYKKVPYWEQMCLKITPTSKSINTSLNILNIENGKNKNKKGNSNSNSNSNSKRAVTEGICGSVASMNEGRVKNIKNVGVIRRQSRNGRYRKNEQKKQHWSEQLLPKDQNVVDT